MVASPAGGRPRHGLALIVVVGVLGVLAVLAVAFVAMAQLERRASEQRVNAARAYLLARSGIEDALARLELGQDAVYGGEDLDGNGLLTAGKETESQVYQPAVLNVADAPARHALRPSFFVNDRTGSGALPALARVDGKWRGYSGSLSGNYAERGNTYALKVSSSNAGIHINGGALDDQDRDPDGPGADPSDYPLNPNAAAEVAPLLPNGIPDHRDASMEGPNGFLVRLLDNLDAVVTHGATSNLGAQVVEARPLGGYKSLDELRPALGQARYDQFKASLALHAWVDPKVVKPQPMDGRPWRWEDVDDAHRIGREAEEISGVHPHPVPMAFMKFNPAQVVIGPLLTLNPGIAGQGTPDAPWEQTITATNAYEGVRTYPVRWERQFVYAWHQLRPAPPALEPRAPLPVNEAAEPVLASVFRGLKGTRLQAWDGAAGWDGGFGFYMGGAAYPYPDEAAEPTPWHRTRLDDGMTYGLSALPWRPWYGPAAYDPRFPSAPHGGGKPLVQCAPLGRLDETPPITGTQAGALASGIIRHRRQRPFRSWSGFDAFVAGLPRWEDLDGNGVLDGAPYTVKASGATYTRRMYLQEDLDSDGIMACEHFPNGAPGLGFPQKDALRAMANPNTDLNVFNPDANRFKEVDKMALAGIRCLPGSHVHTTELALEDAGPVEVSALGRLLGAGGRLQGMRLLSARVEGRRIHRDTTQADFMKDFISDRRTPAEIFFPTYAPPQPSPAPYPLAGSPVIPRDGNRPPLTGLRQALVSYPEPQTVPPGRAADAAYDGQISLGFIGATKNLLQVDTLSGDLFDTTSALGLLDPAVPDLKGPYHEPLLRKGLLGEGNVFPDGVYSEKGRALKYLAAGNVVEGSSFYITCWMKPAWSAEASPRAHALVSLSRASETGALNSYDVPPARVPLDDILLRPVGLYFVPARNNVWQDGMDIYAHSAGSTRGKGWPSRAMIWGTTHVMWASDNLNRRGIHTREKGWMPPGNPSPFARSPVGRLEGRRWLHVGAVADLVSFSSPLFLGRAFSSRDGGGHRALGSWNDKLIAAPHVPDGTPNHVRFGEISGAHNMNYPADATFADVRVGVLPIDWSDVHAGLMTAPAGLGRYFKEAEAAYFSSLLPEGRSMRATWTEIPCELWFDEQALEDGWAAPDGWADTRADDRDGNGRRDVHVEIEVWDDRGTPSTADDLRLARFDDPAADNRIPRPRGRIYYKAVFVNEWDAATRANHPLDVTPFLDDVTITYQEAGGPRIVSWGAGEE